MINLDYSIIPAIVIFLLLILALNYLLFKPLMRVQAERESRTIGLIAKVNEKLDYQSRLYDQYLAAIKNARMEGYRHQEEFRAEAMKKRADVLARARQESEQMIQDSRDSIRREVESAKSQLAKEAQEMARRIASTILERTAVDADTA
jgi:F-type H+-transporting ATPase subunit b